MSRTTASLNLNTTECPKFVPFVYSNCRWYTSKLNKEVRDVHVSLLLHVKPDRDVVESVFLGSPALHVGKKDAKGVWYQRNRAGHSAD